VQPARPDRNHAASLPNEATVLELLRPGHRDSIELGLGTDRRQRLDQSPNSSDARPIASAQSLLEEHLQGRRDDGGEPTQQRSHSCSLRTTSRGRHEADSREVEPGAYDRRNRVADVEERGGVRPRTSRVADPDTQRLGAGSFGRVDEKTAVRYRIREESSQATHSVVAEVSIHVSPGQGHTTRRSHG